MFRARLAWTLAAALWPLPALCQSQAGNPQEVELLKNDSDPTRPVFFSIRPEFSNPGPGVTQASLIFRYDQAALRARRLLPGKHIPVVTVDEFDPISREPNYKQSAVHIEPMAPD